VPAYARSTILIGMRSLPYARPEGGTGAPFFEHRLPLSAFWPLALVCGLSVLLGWRAVLLNAGLILIAGAALVFYQRKIQGITGDMLGALIEITEAGLFFLLAGGKLP
jgi:adenosylcobinamide-GDP ribazoletransferase